MVRRFLVGSVFSLLLLASVSFPFAGHAQTKGPSDTVLNPTVTQSGNLIGSIPGNVHTTILMVPRDKEFLEVLIVDQYAFLGLSGSPYYKVTSSDLEEMGGAVTAYVTGDSPARQAEPSTATSGRWHWTEQDNLDNQNAFVAFVVRVPKPKGEAYSVAIHRFYKFFKEGDSDVPGRLGRTDKQRTFNLLVMPYRDDVDMEATISRLSSEW